MHKKYDSKITGPNRLSWAVVISLGGVEGKYLVHGCGAFKLFKLDSRGPIHINAVLPAISSRVHHHADTVPYQSYTPAGATACNAGGNLPDNPCLKVLTSSPH